ncbi:kumamolisin, partial [mine drainage metagenome]
SESALGFSMEQSYSNTFQMAANNNITVIAASGDRGAYNGGSSLAVNFPAASPYVTSIGGTSLYLRNGAYYQNAWGGGSGSKSFGSGGGFSSVFLTPAWQDPYGYNNPMRGVPDVSMDANTQTGVVVYDQNVNYTVGGTSIGTPIWAGIVAILDQVEGKNLGFINPLLYQISRTNYYGKALQSVYPGTNGYYTTSNGWNPVTGLGTPNMGWLVRAVSSLTGSNGYETIFSPPKNMAQFNVSTYLNISSAKMTPLNGSVYNFLSLQYTPGYG